MKYFSAKKLNILILFFVFVMVFDMFINFFQTRTPESALEYEFASDSTPFNLKTVLNTIDINSNSKFIFYRNYRNNLSHAFVLKKWNKTWEVISIRGQVPIKSKDQNISFFKHTLIFNKNKKLHIYGGIIYNKKINRIFIDEKPAKIIQNEDNIRIWYIETNKKITSDEIKIYDSLGNQISL
jgi:hypothetical protein